MLSRNAQRRIRASLALFSVVTCCQATALAQHDVTPSSTRGVGPGIGVQSERTEPELESCIDAYIAVRRWLDAATLPDLTKPESAVPVAGARGVAVILRHQGRVVGIGTDWPGGGAGDDRMVRRAVGRAVARAFGDRVISALPKEMRDTATQSLALELEFASRPEPLLGRTFAECATRVEPGLDGIALRRGGGGKSTWAAVFPALQHAANTAAASDLAFIALLHDLELPAKDLPDLVRIEAVGVFKFGSLCLTQSDPGDPPLIRGRGTPRFADASVTEASVREFALATLGRLYATRAVDDSEAAKTPGSQSMSGLGLLGNYAPVPDEYKPLSAPPLDQALTAWAAASVAASERFEVADRLRARTFAIALLDDLAIRRVGEDSPTATNQPMAFLLCAVARLGSEDGLSEGAREMARVAREKLAEPLRSGTSGDRALAALAAAVSFSGEGRIVGAAETRAALDAAWASVARPELVGQLPWLVIAEVTFAHATGQAVTHADDAWAVAQLVLAAQAGFGAFASELDLRGGFRLTGTGRGGVTSQSLRPGLAIVALADDSGLVPNGQEQLLRDRARAVLRFAFELALDERESRQFRNPERSRGGIRASLWDSSQPVAASALAILVATSGLEALFPATGLDPEAPRTAASVEVPESSPRETPGLTKPEPKPDH